VKEQVPLEENVPLPVEENGASLVTEKAQAPLKKRNILRRILAKIRR
jgi:hypothetical protein